MKYVLSLLLTTVSFFGCGDDKTERPEVVDEKSKYEFDSSNVIQTTDVEDPNESFLLRYKFEKGKKYNYRFTAISNTSQEVKMADTTISQKVNQQIIYLFTSELKEIDTDSVLEMSCNVNSIKVDANAGDQSFSFESGTKTDSVEKQKFAEYVSMINNPITVRISSIGEILEISKVDRMINAYLEIRGYADSLTTAEKEALRRDFSEGILRPLIIQVFRQLPSQQVAKDTSWSIPQPETPYLVFKMKNSNNYAVTNLEKMNEDKIAVIDATLSSIISGNSSTNQGGISYNFQKPKMDASGKIYFNITDGIIVKAKTTSKAHIEYTMEAPNPQGGKQKGARTEIVENINILELL